MFNPTYIYTYQRQLSFNQLIYRYYYLLYFNYKYYQIFQLKRIFLFITILTNLNKMSQLNREIQIFVKSLNGKTYTVKLKLNDSIQTLVTLAAQKTNTDPNQMRLLFASKQLTDSKLLNLTLADIGLQQGSNVFVIFRLKGGISQ